MALSQGGGVCSRDCDDERPCPQGLSCTLDPKLKARICTPGSPCGSEADCPSGHRCDPATGACYLPVRRDLCAPCTVDGQCPAGGRCMTARSTGERFCSGPCQGEGDCPDGFRCAEVDGAEQRQCLPRSESCHAARPLCAPCVADWECGGGADRCLENLLTGERFCGVACRPSCVRDERGETYDLETGRPCEGACPINFGCMELPAADETYFQCVPNRHTCAGSCDATTPAEERVQCGPGRRCDPETRQCAPASDGRTCAPCVRDSDCAASGGRCVVNRENGESFCAAPCAEDGACLAALGVGFSCVELEGGSFCVPESGSCTSGTLPLGHSCAEGGAASCAGGICLRGAEEDVCSAVCTDDASCGDGRYLCCAVDGDGWDCSKKPTGVGGVCVLRGGRFGADCEAGRPPCVDGYCLDLGGAKLCTAGCESDADCDRYAEASGAFVCREARTIGTGDAPGAPVSICFPAGGGGVGSDCSFGPAACAERICLRRERGDVCTKTCRDGDCPSGWTCRQGLTVDGQALEVCIPGN